ncbi:MAG: DUF2384 domain-containing protein [Bacteroidales bacterium]|nr:DUF2384 domain-containing protein [Bacteroidales bacterium]
MDIHNEKISYDSVDDKTIYSLINKMKEGLDYSFLTSLVRKSTLTMKEWAEILHISERTLQRYKKENRTFDAQLSEKLVQIALLFKLGIEVFGNEENFNSWMEQESMALGNSKPKKLLDNSFGIQLLKDELTRIEHGIMA